MKKRYISILFFIVVLAIFAFILIKFNNYFNLPNVKSDVNLEYSIEEIRDQNETYSVNIYYPITKYEELNLEINRRLNLYLEEFKNEILKYSIDKVYNINITFEYQNQGNYISFIFNITEDFDCINAIKYVETVNFDVKRNKLISIKDLIYKNEGLLKYISKYCYDNLINRDEIKKEEFESFISEGTKPVISNFENFSLYNNKLIIYFNQYQILPYYTDIIKVEISLDNINI